MSLLRLLVIGGVVLTVCNLLDCKRASQSQKRVDDQLDDALDGTFPASDPTASQDFAIPVNRL